MVDVLAVPGGLCSKKTFEGVLDRFEERMLDFFRFLKAFKLGNSEVSGWVWVKPKPFRPSVTSKGRFSFVKGKESSEGDFSKGFCHYLWLANHFSGV